MSADAESFALLRGALDAAGIRFAVGGSWASATFGEPRFTRDVDILAEFTVKSLDAFPGALPEAFFVSRDDAHQALRMGRPFNVIYMPSAGIVRTRGRSLDRNYLRTAAEKLSVGDLLAEVLDLE